MPPKSEPHPKWRTVLEVTVAVSAILGLVLSVLNTWWALDPSRNLVATVLFGDLHADEQPSNMGTITAAIAFQNNGGRREVVLSQALGLGLDTLVYRPKTEQNPFYPGKPIEVASGEVRIVEMSIKFDLREAFTFVSLNRGLFPAPAGVPTDVIAAPIVARVVVLDPNGDRIESFLPIASIWFNKDGTVKQTSGSTPTISLLGESKNAMHWKANRL